MESKIEILIKESLNIAEKKFQEGNTIKEFEKYNNEFSELVSKGFAQERGNNLLSISDIKSIPKIAFNINVK